MRLPSGRTIALVLLPIAVFFAASGILWFVFVYAFTLLVVETGFLFFSSLSSRGIGILLIGCTVSAGTVVTIVFTRRLERSARPPSTAPLWATRAASVAGIAVFLLAFEAGNFANSWWGVRSGTLDPSDLSSRRGGASGLANIVRDGRVPLSTRIQAAKEMSLDRRYQDVLDAFIAKGAASRDPAVRLAITKAMDWSATPSARPLLDDPDIRVQLAVLQSQGLIRNDELASRLEQLMIDGRPAVRMAAFTLWQSFIIYGSPRYLPYLHRLLEGPDEELRLNAATRLGDLHDPDSSGYDSALALVRRRIVNQKDEGGLFLRAAFALGSTRDERAAPVLWTLAHCGQLSDDERQRATLALRQVYVRQGVDAKNEVPERFGMVDPATAQTRPEWVADFCPQR